MKVLLTGANGQLGRALQPLLPGGRFTDTEQLDITDAAAVAAYDWSGIQAIYNAAAFTAVDKAESPEALLTVWRVNVTGVANLAHQARQLDIPFVHISTDYVFAGNATSPIPVEASIDPQGMYGISKAASELAARIAPKHYVVRTSWVFGDGANFVRTMLRLGAERDELTVVGDQLGRPTSAVDLAAALVNLVERPAAYGTYHATGAGEVVSWAEFARSIFELAELDCKVSPISTQQYLRQTPQSAPRPAYSALDLSKLEAAGITMRDWREALADYLKTDRA